MGSLDMQRSDAERDALVWCAVVAQGATLAVLLTVTVIRQSERRFARHSTSSTDNRVHFSKAGSLWMRVKWWLSDDAYFMAMEPCHPDEWILGTLCFAWLVFLASIGTINGAPPLSILFPRLIP